MKAKLIDLVALTNEMLATPLMKVSQEDELHIMRIVRNAQLLGARLENQGLRQAQER